MIVIPIMRSGMRLVPDVLARLGGTWEQVHPVWVSDDGRVRGHLPAASEYVVVEANVATGATVLAIIRHIRRRFPHARVRVVGTAHTTAGARLLEENLDPDRPLVDRYLVFLAGFPGSGKSLLAHMLAGFPDVRVYRWRDYLPAAPGRYGEALAEKEARDPFLVPRHFLATSGVVDDPARVVVVDGVKDAVQAETVAFALERPAFIVWVSVGREAVRQRNVRARGDADDPFDAERRRLFGPRLATLRRRAHVRVRWVGRKGLEGLFFLYDLLGFKPAGRTVRQPWASKEFVLDWLLHAALRRPEHAGEPLYRVHTSGSYARKLRRLGIGDRELLAHVDDIRRGFMVLDDVLDEDTVRNGRAALWTRVGPVAAAMTGIAYVARAARVARARGHGEDFAAMLRAVVEGVRVEVRAEERGLAVTPEVWLQAAAKEAAL